MAEGEQLPRALERQLHDLRAKVGERRKELSALDGALAERAARLAAEEARLAVARAQLRPLLEAAYRLAAGDSDRVAALDAHFRDRDLAAFSRRALDAAEDILVE
jgi:hypothetical protein